MNYSENEKKVKNIKQTIKTMQNEFLMKKSLQYGFDFLNDRPLNEKGFIRKLDEDVCKAVNKEL
jgi:hypothetical protein